jgi:sugar/nucleoside kinase (ribokinase family)
MLDMLTIGDIKLDTFVVLDHAAEAKCQLKMPECLLCLDYGAKIAVDVVDAQIAGSAPNVAVGLSRMGYRTAVRSVMGQDTTRPLAFETLASEGVSTRYVQVGRNEKSSYSVVLNFKGEKTILTSHIRHSYHLPKPMPSTRWMYVGEMGGGYEQLYRETIAYLRRAKSAVYLGFNPGSIQVAEKKKVLYDLIRQAYVLFVNKEEAQQLTHSTSLEPHHLAHAVWELGPRQVVITDGPNGAWGFDGAELNFCPLFPGPLIEATGAGDAFATGFIGALMHGNMHDEALRWGSVNATSVVHEIGPTKGLLSISQIHGRLRSRPSFKVKTLS